MNSYELRILKPHGRYADIFASSHISDLAAIERAMSLASNGELIEVWRDLVCVYSGTPEGALPQQ
jgi:hypothetical protein